MPAPDRFPAGSRFRPRPPGAREAWGALLAGVMAIGGCARSGAPTGFLPPPDAAATAIHGGWITLEGKGPRRVPIMSGEFLAQAGDTVYVLTEEGFRGVNTAAFDRATLWGYDPQAGPLGAWVLAGSLSTLSHGFVLIFSAPVWIVGGSAIAGSQSRASRLIWPDHPWSELRAYARYPGGLPPGLPRSSLRFR